MMIDSHAHLADPAFASDLADVLARARAAGVEAAVVPGTDVESSRAAAALAASGRTAGVRIAAAVGLHPHAAAAYDDAAEAEIEALAGHPGVVAIGEIGLDGRPDAGAHGYPPIDLQVEAFRRQARLARRLGLPVIVHMRDAEEATLSILEAERPPAGVLHSWTGSAAGLERGVAAGFHVSFAGIVAFPRSDGLRRVAAAVPAGRLLVETDSPYLAPPPHRGRRCEPAFLPRTVEAIAAARGQTPATVAEVTALNAIALFAIR